METKILKMQKSFTEEGRTRRSDEKYIELYSIDSIMYEGIKEASEKIYWNEDEISAMTWLYHNTMNKIWEITD